MKALFTLLLVIPLLLLVVVVVGGGGGVLTTSVYAQQQAPESEKSQGKGQGPPFNQGICITTRNLNPTVTPKSEQAREVCNEPGQVSNPGECKQILKEHPGIFGADFTEEDCHTTFPYRAPNSHNPND
jgi:hypothetical protein